MQHIFFYHEIFQIKLLMSLLTTWTLSLSGIYSHATETFSLILNYLGCVLQCSHTNDHFSLCYLGNVKNQIVYYFGLEILIGINLI